MTQNIIPKLVPADRAERYFRCFQALKDYIYVQDNQGLISWLAPAGTPISRTYYRTHWGAQNGVMAPEMLSIAARYGFQLTVTVDMRQRKNGSWTKIEGDLSLLEKTAYVQVSNLLYE